MENKDYQLRSMQERIEYLEEAYRLLLDNLNGLISSRKFIDDPTNIRDPHAIVAAAGEYIKKLFAFKEISFLLVDEPDADFFIAYCAPEYKRKFIQQEVDAKIEDGTFAWALRQNHPVIVPSKRQGLTTILHVLTTQFRTRGMFVGTIEKSSLNVTDPLLIMLTVLTQNISYSIESAILYKMIKDKAMTLELILKSTGEGIMGLDPEGKIIFANPAIADMTGFEIEELIGKYHHDLLHHTKPDGTPYPQEECLLYKAFKDRRAHYIDDEIFWKKDGSSFPAEYTSNPMQDEQMKLIGAVVMLRNITERKRAEQEKDNLQEQLLQAHKMQAVGQLAGGVAHDFNNILTAIISYGHILLAKMGKNDALRTYVDHMLSSSERAAHLVTSLLAFSRKQTINLKPTDVNRIVTEVKTLLIRILGEDIELNTMLTDKDAIVMADGNQIEQVLMNLATNARDAMPNGGTLTIGTDLKEMDDKFIQVHGYGEVKKYALITVSDTGVGMTEEVTARIFEPFFTTKEVGKGTGLGLAMAYGIIKQHNGYIKVNSALGRGTSFTIFLPVLQSAIEERKSETDSVVRGGTETVLLAEDNAEVREAAHEILAGGGYTIIEAVDGEEALQKFLENKEKIHLLIIDIIMPKKNGKEIYEEIKKIKSDIKAIFTSGYTADNFHWKSIEAEGLEFIPKPFSPDILLEKIRDVLDKGK